MGGAPNRAFASSRIWLPCRTSSQGNLNLFLNLSETCQVKVIKTLPLGTWVLHSDKIVWTFLLEGRFWGSESQKGFRFFILVVGSRGLYWAPTGDPPKVILGPCPPGLDFGEAETQGKRLSRCYHSYQSPDHQWSMRVSNWWLDFSFSPVPSSHSSLFHTGNPPFCLKRLCLYMFLQMCHFLHPLHLYK